jgi:membrane fusion protein (multidrug efflux system)
LAAQKKDVEISRIGLRDEDLVARGVKVPTSEKERIEALVVINTLTLRAEVEAAKSQLDSAETQLSSIREMLDKLWLRAPSDGVVGALYVERGEHLTQNAKVMTLMDTKEVYAVFPVQESDSNRIREGMHVDITVDAFRDRFFSSAISQIAPIIDSQTGSVTVKAIMPNKANQLRPGLFIRARINLGTSRDIVKLPDSAIIQKRGSLAKVFTVVNGKAFMKEVHLGEELEGAHIVEKGIRPGEIIIDSPSPLLREGEDVEIKE